MGYNTFAAKAYGAHDGDLARLFHFVTGEPIDSVTLGQDDKGYDFTFFGATSGSKALWDESADEMYFDGADLWLKDGDQLEFGDSSDVVVDWTSTGAWTWVPAANNTQIDIGSAALSFDVSFFVSGGELITIDASADELNIVSGAYLRLGDYDAKTALTFGDSNDVTAYWTSTGAFNFTAAANNSAFNFGTAAKSFDVTFSGSGGSLSVDASADKWTLADQALVIKDEDAATAYLAFGDAEDITVSWQSTGKLMTEAAANNSAWEIGTAALSIDVDMKGSGGSCKWDASADEIILTAAELNIATAGKGIFMRYNSTVSKTITLNSTGNGLTYT